MISKEKVKHIAKLARLGLKEEEIKSLQKDLSSILDFIGKLKQVDISGVEASFNITPEAGLEKGMREDEPRKEKEEAVGKILKETPESENNHIKVKPIF